MKFSQIEKTIEAYREDIISGVKDLIKHESTEGEKEEGKPFGPEVADCLKDALQLADDLGLKTENIDGYAGIVEMGSGEEMLGILCHLDIVPAGDDWSYPPFEGVIEEGKLYGRGVLDNKGPAVGVIYAIKALKDLRVNLNKRLRLILGTNEESGFGGITYYCENAELPDIAFSPDAVYPVIHAEKGITIFDLIEKFTGGGEEDDSGRLKVVEIEGGNAPNMVPDRSLARLTGDYEYLQEKVEEFNENFAEKLELNRGDNFYHLVCHGVSAHGSKPGDGKNAISHLLGFLQEIDLVEDDITSFIHSYNELIGLDYHGQKIGCAMEDKVSGKLVFNVGQIEVDDEGAKVTVNIRYPVRKNVEEVYEKIEENIDEFGWKLRELRHKEPLFVEKDDDLVQSLMAVYRTATGDEDAEPIAIGGGTYARAVPKGVAFGPLFPGEPELAHQKDEYIKVDDLIRNAAIYTGAMIALAADEDIE